MRMSGSLIREDFPAVEASILEALITQDATLAGATIRIVTAEEEVDVETKLVL